MHVRYGRGIEAALLGVAVGELLLAGLLWRRRRAATQRQIGEHVLAPLRGKS